jgi:hypothetical protein
LSTNSQFHSFDEILIAIGEGSLDTLDFIKAVYPQTSKKPTLGYLNFLETSKIKLEKEEYKPVAIKIVSKDMVGQLEKILKVMSELNVNVIKTKAYLTSLRKENNFICRQVIAVKDFARVSVLFENLEQIEGVKSVERLFWQRKLLFIIGCLLTFSIWAIHPYLLHYLANEFSASIENPFLGRLLRDIGVILLFILVLSLRVMTRRSFPELRETATLWALTFSLGTFALITLIAEVYFFRLSFDLLLDGGIILLVIAYLTYQYFRYRKSF